MQFSDTTNKNGLIQEIEFWTGLGDGVVSGTATLKKQITSRVNRAYERIMPLLLSMSDTVRWDDVNHTDQPNGTSNIASGQHTYQFLVDDNGLSILNIARIMYLDSATSTEYRELPRMTLDDPRAINAMSPNPSETGVPTHYLEKDNTVYLYPQPNYSHASGLKLFFERIPSYFVDTDTSKTPGIPAHFHQLLALITAKDWLVVNKAEATVLIADVKEEIKKEERNLKKAINARGPKRQRLIGARVNSV